MPKINRRTFTHGLAGAVSLAALARPNFSFAVQRSALPIPAELRPQADGTVYLKAQTGQMNMHEAGPTSTYGVNGPFLGPAIRVNRGDALKLNVTNALPEPTAMHWHGIELPGEMDGGPFVPIQPGGSWQADFTVDQPAATCWFHPHFYPTTAEQVIKGFAGLFIIGDENEATLGLPSNWGVDDIPVIIQDRRFTPEGQFFSRFNLAAVTSGYVGDTALVNGAFYPTARCAQGILRLRLLNGSNARSYRLRLSTGRDFFCIASDGGLLAEPVQMNELTLYAGERYEILVDARDGQAFDLVTHPVDQMAMILPPFDQPLPLVTFDPSGAQSNGVIPDALATLPPVFTSLPPASVNLRMDMNMDKEGMTAFAKTGLMDMMKSGVTDPEVVAAMTKLIAEGPALPLAQQLSANAVNGTSFSLENKPMEVAKGQDMRWTISEGTDQMLHPVHIHGCQFRILTINGQTPPKHMAGWKDIAPVSKGGSVDIQVRFNHGSTAEKPFMAHCHILEHEDSGMMTSFTVS